MYIGGIVVSGESSVTYRLGAQVYPAPSWAVEVAGALAVGLVALREAWEVWRGKK